VRAGSFAATSPRSAAVTIAWPPRAMHVSSASIAGATGIAAILCAASEWW
jgi:hypothetical protein